MPNLSASAHVSAANTLTLLIKTSAMVTVYREHRRTLFCLPVIIFLFIRCIGIIIIVYISVRLSAGDILELCENG